MEDVVFNDNLEYFTAISYDLWPFGIVCGHLVYFFPFWYVWTDKNLATLMQIRFFRRLSLWMSSRAHDDVTGLPDGRLSHQ
jgi:hypothetical protein